MTTCPEGAEDVCDRRFVSRTHLRVGGTFYRPYRADLVLYWFLGLKPQAESFNPFGMFGMSRRGNVAKVE